MADPRLPVILFDGVCNLCDASVQWVIRRDRDGAFHFASLQSEVGRALLAQHGIHDAPLSSVILIDDRGVATESEAALRVVARLRGPARALLVARLVPRPLRDAIYRWVARNRYRWFGKKDACMIPTPALRVRFLDADEARS